MHDNDGNTKSSVSRRGFLQSTALVGVGGIAGRRGAQAPLF